MVNNRKPICDNNLNHISNLIDHEFSDDEDIPATSTTDSKKGFINNIVSNIQKLFPESNPK